MESSSLSNGSWLAVCGKARRASTTKKWRRILANDDAMTMRVLPPRKEEMNNDRQTVTIRVRLSASGSVIDYDSHPRRDRSDENLELGWIIRLPLVRRLSIRSLPRVTLTEYEREYSWTTVRLLT